MRAGPADTTDTVSPKAAATTPDSWSPTCGPPVTTAICNPDRRPGLRRRQLNDRVAEHRRDHAGPAGHRQWRRLPGQPGGQPQQRSVRSPDVASSRARADPGGQRRRSRRRADVIAERRAQRPVPALDASEHTSEHGSEHGRSLPFCCGTRDNRATERNACGWPVPPRAPGLRRPRCLAAAQCLTAAPDTEPGERGWENGGDEAADGRRSA